MYPLLSGLRNDPNQNEVYQATDYHHQEVVGLVLLVNHEYHEGIEKSQSGKRLDEMSSVFGGLGWQVDGQCWNKNKPEQDHGLAIPADQQGIGDQNKRKSEDYAENSFEGFFRV